MTTFHHHRLAIVAVSLCAAATAVAAGHNGGPVGATIRSQSPAMHATTVQSPMTTKTLGPTRTGQPNQSCGSVTAPNTPGNAASAPGSAFNPNGHAGTVYAGQQPQNSVNSASVSQYDAACSHQP